MLIKVGETYKTRHDVEVRIVATREVVDVLNGGKIIVGLTKGAVNDVETAIYYYSDGTYRLGQQSKWDLAPIPKVYMYWVNVYHDRIIASSSEASARRAASLSTLAAAVPLTYEEGRGFIL